MSRPAGPPRPSYLRRWKLAFVPCAPEGAEVVEEARRSSRIGDSGTSDAPDGPPCPPDCAAAAGAAVLPVVEPRCVVDVVVVLPPVTRDAEEWRSASAAG